MRHLPLETGATAIGPATPVDLSLTLGQISRVGLARSIRRDGSGAWWRATRTPDGPVTVRYARSGGGIVVAAWGPGTRSALEAAPWAVGARDSLEGFDPPPGLVRELFRRFPGLRIPRTGAVFEMLLPTILGQKVTSVEAGAARRRLLAAWGEPAPAPPGGPMLVLSPDPKVLAAQSYQDFHPLGVERRRAEAIRFAASRAPRLEEASAMELRAARRRLRAFPCVGAWTAAEVAAVALGDPDAVPVGDYHVPNTVAWALAGEPRGDDTRMLELLAPFAGHRLRVIRLLEAAGIGAPKFGPRSTVRSIREI